MQDYELDAWLGGAPVSEEQRAALLIASDAIDTRYPDDEDASQRAFTEAAQVILGDGTVQEAAAVWSAARVAERDAMAALTGAIIAAQIDDRSETWIAEHAGVNRGTVRKALGK